MPARVTGTIAPWPISIVLSGKSEKRCVYTTHSPWYAKKVNSEGTTVGGPALVASDATIATVPPTQRHASVAMNMK